MIAGVCGSLFVHLLTGGRGWGVVTPAIAGLAAAGAAWVVTLTAVPKRTVRTVVQAFRPARQTELKLRTT